MRAKPARGQSYNGARKGFGNTIENNINLNKLGNDIASFQITGEAALNATDGRAPVTEQQPTSVLAGQGAWRKEDTRLAKNKIMKQGRPPTGRDLGAAASSSTLNRRQAPSEIGITGRQVISSHKSSRQDNKSQVPLPV